MPSYLADEKSIYCTDGFVAYATPFGYGISSALCGLSYHVDVLNPGRAFVVDHDTGRRVWRWWQRSSRREASTSTW